ncbi:cell cycle regulator of non-homologous end joining [Oreochromis niloticus]|uniref:cell cycle regulator of non-homologous end joining n=1 Tax=Oreochromis niloticus TaxID=8128 RepID=UPI00022B1D7F|nr:cell cycle regulator of non-homologous end joining [Oreochromis niloticus]CAI5664426.1 unnamed protein product [Mustela putorius furo]
MSGRHRSLPSWMAKKEEKSQEKKPLKRKRKAARSAFYCMNEQELVEAAVSYFTNGSCEDLTLVTRQQGKQKAVDTVKKMGKSTNSQLTANPVAAEESPSDCTEDLDMTYVSETDLDITEVETLLYTSSPQQQTPEGQRSGTVENVEAGKTNEPPQTAAEDSDALRLVREIFFS